MADPFSTVAAVVSLADVMIRACDGISTLVIELNDAPQAALHLRHTTQSLQSVLENLRLYVSEYESSNLFIEERQMLPDVVKNELLGIRAELDLLQKYLPLPDTKGKIGQRMSWFFNEKQISKAVRRLESRQTALMTGLQTVAQRNGIKIYEKLSDARDRMQQTQSSINQFLDEVARVESDSLTAQTSTLNGIRMLAENVPDNHKTTMDKLDQLGSILASIRMDEAHQRSTTTLLEASTPDYFMKILRAELQRVVKPTVEEFLDSYKSNHEVQLEGIRKNLDQIILDLGRSSQDQDVSNPIKGSQESFTNAETCDTQDDDLPPCDNTIGNMDRICSGVSLEAQSNRGVLGSRSRSWSKSWSFRWRIGVLIVTVSASQSRSRLRRRSCQAFKITKPSSARQTYRVSLGFQPASSVWVRRGISMVCESKQDQRGYYQICPKISTFAIVSRDADVFMCVMRGDISGLQCLFEAQLAAPTDRDLDSISLLHLASTLGRGDMCQFLLREGADPFAITRNGINIMSLTQKMALKQYLAPAGKKLPWAVDYYSITRELICSGLDLNDAFSGALISPYRLERQEQPFLEDPSKPLLDWAAFLRDQGLVVGNVGKEGLPVCFPHLSLRSHDERDMRWHTKAVLMLCFLKADVSIREAETGMQALHFLFAANLWSAELSSYVMNLAYILVHFGGADVHAVDYYNNSPTMYAFWSGWEKEWEIVLDRCGFGLDEVVIKEIERLHKTRFLGNGESTAIDTEDLSIPSSAFLSRRRVVDARLDE